jgi:hypothetical protein
MALLFPALPVRASSREKLSVPDQLRGIAAGSPMEVQLQGGTRLRGLLGERTSEGFVLQVSKDGSHENQVVKFERAQSIRTLKSLGKPASWRKPLIVVGAIFGGLALFVAIALRASTNS